MKKYYSIVFLQFLSVEIAGSILMLFFLNRGMSLFQGSAIIAVFAVTVLVMEIPTGAVADLYGRRISVSLGFIFYTFSCFINLISYNFIGLALAAVVNGIGYTLFSGALEAWAVDTIKYHDSDADIKVMFSKAGVIRNFAILLSGILGGYLAYIDFNIPWIVSIVVSSIAAVTTFLIMKEPYFKRKKQYDRHPLKEFKVQIETSCDYALKHKSIFIFLVISVLISFSNSSANAFQQPRFVGLWGKEEMWIVGWIRVGYSLMMMLGSHIIGYLSRKGKKDKDLILYTCLTLGIWLLLSSVFNSFIVVLGTFYIYEIGRGMYRPAKQIFLNNRIESEKRATVLSFQSALSQLGMIAGLLITGYITNLVSGSTEQIAIRIAWSLCGGMAIIAAVISLSLRKKKSVYRETNL